MKLFKTWVSAIAMPLALTVAPAFASIPAHPGIVNYVEGQARVNGQTVTAKSVGTVDVSQGEIIETGNGKAEVLLTPGVFLRLGDNSAVRMDSAGLTDTRIALLSGRAMIEADNLQKANNIRILDGALVTRLEKNGIYSFSANPTEVATYDGKVQVTENDHTVELGKGHKATAGGELRETKFDRKADERDPLYQWSKLRSQYLAEANIEQSRTFVVNNAGWYGGGWYWNPGFGMYSWIPGDGMFYGPFGWGFYSPFTVWQAPVFYRGYYGGGFRGGTVGVRPRIYSGAGVQTHAFHGGGAGRVGGGFSHRR